MATSPAVPKPLARTLIFGVLALGLLLGLWRGWLAPPAAPSKGQRALLYQRAGDTYVRMVYLTGDPNPASPTNQSLLERALGYYQLSVKENPLEVKALASLGLTLHALKRDTEADLMLSAAALRPQPASQRKAVRATLIVVLSSRGKPDELAVARGFMSELAPGPLALAEACGRTGNGEAADREWSKAEGRARSLIPGLVALLTVCGLLLLMGLAGLVGAVVAATRRSPSSREPPIPAAWGIQEAAEALVVWVILATAVGGLLHRLGVFPTRVVLGRPLVVVPSLIAGCGAVAWVWAASPRGARFGWGTSHLGRDVGRGLAAAGLGAPVVVVLDQLLQMVFGPWEHPLVPVFAEAHGAQAVLLVVAACVAAPALEETLFRGILFRALRRRWSFPAAAALSAVIFALGHSGWSALLPYLLLGGLFAWLYERSGSLVAPAVAHGAFNGFNLAIVLVLYAG